MPAYWTIQAVLTEMYGDEAESFTKFPAFAERFMAADEYSYCYITYHAETYNFQAAFFAPGGIRRAGRWICSFIGIDGTHTGSKFWMTLLIAVGIDANNKTLPMAWALVPIESESWWTWFLEQFMLAYCANVLGVVFMSDREKGLPAAINKVFPKVT
jgi:MULE transposase domain